MTFSSNAWMILHYDTWPNVNMPCGIKIIIIIKLILGW